MALSRTDYGPYLASPPQGTGAFSTGSFTPPDNSLLVALVLGGTDSPASENSYVTTGGSLTWTKRVFETITYSGDGLLIQFWTAPVTTGASMTVTSTHTGINSYNMSIWPYAYTGYDTGSPIGGTASDNDATGTNSLTLSATPASTSEVIAALMLGSATATPTPPTTGVTVTAGSSFTAILQQTITNSFARWQTQSRTSSTSTAVSWTTTTDASTPFDQRIYAAMEIKAAAANTVGNGLTSGLKLQRLKLAA